MSLELLFSCSSSCSSTQPRVSGASLSVSRPNHPQAPACDPVSLRDSRYTLSQCSNIPQDTHTHTHTIAT